ncbi:MAG: ATP-binding protein [Planctomycetota bacterium]
MKSGTPRDKARRVRLKPADSFDLIRLLARSQNDPRKAVCELVQNSLDAEARRIEITWQNDKGARVLRVRDDGTGVFPALPREDALRRIATTIGHSHKRALTPAQRRELMALGKYGIGLLGFWSVGKQMEIRSRTGGEEAWVLRLEEDKPDAVIERLRARRVDDQPTFTEIVIRFVHEGAARQIRPGRLQAYLASELRGQLLGRDVEVHIHDRVARGLAHKHFIVRPMRFLGRHLAQLASLAVPGHEDARLELYLLAAEDERRGRVQLACGGTTVLDDIVEAFDEDGPRVPWDSGRIEGVIDFPELDVAPGTRRGFQRDGAALAFLTALAPLEMELVALIHEDERVRVEQQGKSLAREIRRAFRRVALALPEYDLFDVRASGGSAGVRADAGADGAALASAEPQSDWSEAVRERAPVQDAESSLFPPGPLDRVRVQPSHLRVAPGAVRTLKARAVDADGRAPEDAIAWTWTLDGAGELVSYAGEARYCAAEEPGRARILVRATSTERAVETIVEVEVLAELAAQERVAGIPEPESVSATGEMWRSRFVAGRWQFNSAHRDYVAAQVSEARRVRYLVHLFVKEVVLRNFGQPSDGALLERMVELLTHLDSGPTVGR